MEKEHFKIHVENRVKADRYSLPPNPHNDLLLWGQSSKFEDLLERTLGIPEKLWLKTRHRQASKKTNKTHHHLLPL